MSGDQTGDRGVLSSPCSQDSSVTSTSVSADPPAGPPPVPDKTAHDSRDSNSSQSALSESEVSSTSANNDKSWSLTSPIEVGYRKTPILSHVHVKIKTFGIPPSGVFLSCDAVSSLTCRRR